MPPELGADAPDAHEVDRLAQWTLVGAFACVIIVVILGLMILMV